MLISDNVKLVPGSLTGKLQFIEKEFIWRSETDQFHMKMERIEIILIDKLGATVLFTTMNGDVSRMIHFGTVEDLERFETVLMEFIGDNRDEFEEICNTETYVQIRRRNDYGELDEATVNLLEAFSKIPSFARDILSKIKGDPQNLRRPRGINQRNAKIPLNPWIIDKPMKLPACRIKPVYTSVNMVESLPFENQATMIYNSGGKIVEGCLDMRLKLWSTVLNSETVHVQDIHAKSDDFHSIECDNRIEKDLNRIGEIDKEIINRLEKILKKYCVDDPEIGYVQGMADLALPFARLCADGEKGYEMFRGLMKRIRGNFLEDQAGSHETGIEAQLRRLRDLINSSNPLLGDYLKFNQDSDNLFFTYRWLLVLFRREFDGNDADRLWDVMMAAEVSGIARIEDYRVYLGLAMILGRKDEFMRTCARFEDLLKVRSK